MLPGLLDCPEFINADEIAKGLSPFQPERASIDAGRIMIKRMNEMLRLKEDFAIETTLATKSYVGFIKKAKELGYFVTLLFFWLNSPGRACKCRRSSRSRRCYSSEIRGGAQEPV